MGIKIPMPEPQPARAGRPRGAGNYITRRGDIWYLNYNLPEHIRAEFDGATRIRESLKTSDRSVALQTARPLVAAIEAKIEGAHSANRPEALLFRQISDTVDAAEIARLSTSDDEGGEEREREVIKEKVAEYGPKLEAALKRRQNARLAINGIVRKLTEDVFWVLEPYWTLSESDEFSQNVLSTLKNELGRTIQILNNKFTASNSFTLDWAYEVWKSQKTRPKQTTTEARKHLDEFKTFASLTLIEEVRRKQLVDWRNELKNTKLRDNTLMAVATVNQRLNNVLVVLRVGWREMEIPGFDTERILLGSETKRKRQDWDRDDILKALNSLEPGSGMALLFALGLLFGPRIGEFCSVLVEDVSMKPNLMWIELRDERTKMKKGRSIVLVDMIRPAIERVMKGRKKSDYLLDVPRPRNPDLKIGHEASKKFGRLMDDLGIERVFHELRHTFKAWSRLAEVQQVTIDQICGHAPANIGAIYGKGKYADLKVAAEKVFDKGFDAEMRAAFVRMLGPA